MDIDKILNLLNKVRPSFNIYERRPDKYQLTVPILHEDGDMLDIYLQKSPKGGEYVRVCDFGMTLMRLSYNYEFNTDSKRKTLNSILINNGVENSNGNLFLDTPINKIYESVFQFSGCIQKVCSMDYWNRETAQSSFYKDLHNFVSKDLTEFNPKPDLAPLKESVKKPYSGDELIKVDWSLQCENHQFYLFEILGNSKAKDTAIALLEFKKINLSFISLIVHENIQNLGNKESGYLTRNADKQYIHLSDFNNDGVSDIKRYANAS